MIQTLLASIAKPSLITPFAIENENRTNKRFKSVWRVPCGCMTITVCVIMAVFPTNLYTSLTGANRNGKFNTESECEKERAGVMRTAALKLLPWNIRFASFLSISFRSTNRHQHRNTSHFTHHTHGDKILFSHTF